MWNFLGSDMKWNVDKTKGFDMPDVLTHGLQHLRHFPHDNPVRHMTYGNGAAGFISLHQKGAVTFYHPDGRIRDPPSTSISVPYVGLTSTCLPGRLVGWGPGPRLTLLDDELRPLVEAPDPPDVRACQATKLSVVTAGAGNVCVWCLTYMVCLVRVTEDLGLHSIFTQLVLAPRGPKKPQRAFAVYQRAVVVVDLTAGHVLEHRQKLHRRDITALAHSAHLDCVVSASKDDSIRVWGPDWGLRLAFEGHTGLVTSLSCCPESGLLLSASLDGTLRSWNLEVGDQVQCLPLEGGEPLMALGGPMKGDTFFTFSQIGVDFWSMNNLYNLHCRLGGNQSAPVRQIVVTSFPPPYPTRALCVSGHSNITLIATETGTILTSFSPGSRVMWADYCLLKEILLVLTEDGTLIRASTLTNPAKLLKEWEGLGQRDVERDQGVAGPGPASCVVIYSSISDGQRTLDDWKTLQEHRGQGPSNKKPLQDAYNRHLVMLGHNSGFISVLMLDTGKVRYRTPAHNGQRITSLQADPGNSFLLTAGEDKAVLVWRVFPNAQECLSMHLNLFCEQPPLHMALLGPLLAVDFQETSSATYSLVHFNLLNQSRTEHPPSEDHLDSITGLCVCQQLRVFASSSQDGTVCIWDEENRLMRTFQLGAQPECLAFSGDTGDMLLGIRGDLYRIRCSHVPHDLQLQILCTEMSDRIPDLPIPQTPTTTSNTSAEGSPTPEESTGEQDLIEDLVYKALLAQNRDLASLQEGTAERKSKAPSTEKTRKEAFDCYMRLVYGQPLNIQIEDEDMFDIDAALFPPKPLERRKLTPPTARRGFFQNLNLAKPLSQVGELEPVPAQRNLVGFKPNSVLVGRLWPKQVVENTVPKNTVKLRDALCQEPEQWAEQDVKPKPSKAPSPPPRTRPGTPNSNVPGVLKRVEDRCKDVCPDQNLILESLCPEDSEQLLEGSAAQQNMKLLHALLALRRQGALHNTDELRKCLMDYLHNIISSDMSEEELQVVREMLNELVCLDHDSHDVIVELLTLLAHRHLRLPRVLCLLKEMGVKDADPWLVLEVDAWSSMVQGQPEPWENLREMAIVWLDTITSKYKMQNWALFVKKSRKKNLFTHLDVLNYFCSPENVNSLKAPSVPQEECQDNILLLPDAPRSKPIQGLGKTYTMSRIRKPPGVVLPVLSKRPFLMGFTPFLTLPLPKINLLPFQSHVDQHNMKASFPHYFLLERSYVHYYQ